MIRDPQVRTIEAQKILQNAYTRNCKTALRSVQHRRSQKGNQTKKRRFRRIFLHSCPLKKAGGNMSLQQKLEALNARLQTILKPGVDDILDKHMRSLKTDGFLDHVLEPGDKAPSFTLTNQYGDLVSSADLLSKGPLVVSFTRGGWCPFCVEEANAYEEIYDRFLQIGAQIVFLTPQALSGIEEWTKKTPFRFSVLRDEGSRVGDAFGVVYTFPDDLRQLYETAFSKNIPEINDAEGWKLPVPACFVLDQQGTIWHAEADPNYRMRPEPTETLSRVQELNVAKGPSALRGAAAPNA